MTVQETLLKTRQVAEALGVSVSTVKRLINAGQMDATRTVGKHRLVTRSSVIEFARRENYSVGSLEAIGPEPSFQASDGSTSDQLLEALKQGDRKEVIRLIELAASSPKGAVGLADEVIRPVMARIGQAWLLGTWGIHHEHQATQSIILAIGELIGKLSRMPASSPRLVALGSAPEGDVYILPVLLGELVLREAGWDVRNLGPNLPLKSLAAAIREYRPRLVFLSASHLADRARFFQEYAYVYEAASQVRAAIILGGRGFDPELRSRLVYASFGERMSHLAEFARTLLPPDNLARTEIAGPTSTMTTST